MFSRTVLDYNSWIDVGVIDPYINVKFNELWDIHPDEYGVVKIMGKYINTPRYQQSYINNYTFSGIKHKALDLPDIIKPYYEWVNTLGYGEFNQVLVNWYANGHHYIGPHSDSIHELVDNSPIVSISLGATRVFRIKHKKDTSIHKRDFSLTNGTVLIMGGEMQKHFKHEISPIRGKKGENIGKRINITFRQFK